MSHAFSRLAILKDRAECLKAVRYFFDTRGVMEVDCPLLSRYASVDAHIHLIEAKACGERVFLHSSPEYGMKRLLSEGMGDIYQLAHVFREGEIGLRHNPEFMMIEWYRLSFSFNQMIHETAEVICLFLGPLPCKMVSYRDLFLRELAIDPFLASEEELKALCLAKEISLYSGVEREGRDGFLNLLLTTQIEPRLGKTGLEVLTDYPVSQAALARSEAVDGVQVGKRFEIYFQGIELANGYHELADPIEQRRRLVEANEAREKAGHGSLPIDERFLMALQKGLPDCCGVAVGFDRLMMLRHHLKEIETILSWAWHQA